MKMLILAVVTMIAIPSFAGSELCSIKQANAAIFELAQKLGVSVTKGQVDKVTPGVWTAVMTDSTGSDEVTVTLPTADGTALKTVTYTVGAKQVGPTNDCKILAIGIARE